MSVCLVTGGAGFLGSHLVEALAAEDHAVRVVDNFTTGKPENLGRVMDAVELYPGDCADRPFLTRVMRGVEVVFHFGCGNEPHDAGEAAVTRRVLEAAESLHVRRLVFASCARVYPGRPGLAVEETTAPLPSSPFARAKLSGEEACCFATRVHGLETVRLRYFNVFGPRQPPDSPYAQMLRSALQAMHFGRPPVFEGDQHLEQDLIYVDDAVHAALLAARCPRVSGGVYNIARGQSTACGEVVAVLNGLLGTQVAPSFTDRARASSLNNRAVTRRAEAELGFCAATDLRTGLSRCLQALSVPHAAVKPNGLQAPHRPLRGAPEPHGS
jgi:UDP-glucose 4-epimerase